MPYREPPERAVLVLRSLGAELRRARYARAFSQAALAGHGSVSQSTVSMLERGLALGLRISRYALMIAVLRRAPERPLRLRDRFDELGPSVTADPLRYSEASADPDRPGPSAAITGSRWAEQRDEPPGQLGDERGGGLGDERGGGLGDERGGGLGDERGGVLGNDLF
jgi:transcriptional regulator with XRE-family HTH domain